MICDVCLPIFQSPDWGDHHADIASLLESAADGCYICQPLLQYALKKSGSLENSMAKPYTYRLYQTQPRGIIIVDMSIFQNDGKDATDEYWLLQMVPSSDITADLGIRHGQSAIPVSEASRVAQGCCQKNHEPVAYPRRLLEIRESTIRLVSPIEERLKAPYEAIEVLRGLSIRYLWIDALCIIQSGQGSTEDWQEESAKMQEVYSNSIICLSLFRAAQPGESCLAECSPHTTMPPFQVEATGYDREEEKEEEKEEPTAYTVLSNYYYSDALYDQPLALHAWGLQERLLPPRVFSFGLGEFFWDCTEMPNACESFPRGLRNHIADNSPADDIIGLTDKVIPATSDRETLESFWWRILEEYTDRSLTYPEKDKLVAFSAISTRMQTALDDTYLAGHFWRLLPASLNWQVEPPLPSMKRREGTPRRIVQSKLDLEEVDKRREITPSWSWASMEGSLFLKPPPRIFSLADAHSITLQAHSADVKWIEGSPVFVGEPPCDIKAYHFQVDIDDPEDHPEGGATCSLLPLTEDDWLGRWEGLVLKEVVAEGGIMYERIGHFIISDPQDMDNRPWRDDYKTVFGQEKRTMTLV
ncbi:hypothetical protein BO71DRAFT_451242 [Aspergillus ellipticus CBS 707.79]|uniref:Heterokaryon incompatibility domain-containing protein n=1 Tax=Aspergillus ellipticus CBS 707.79 TaxID=1448320 RepID=A0A319D610_9EURO|nr:hypothetical protein BO71DRAFT_451242 [Aspergillus ellipticus CBS 707.79]